MAPSISRSCAVSCRIRAMLLLSMRGLYGGRETLLYKGRRPAGERLPANSMADLLLCFLHVGCLRTLRALDDFELDRITFLQSAISVSDNGGIVYEHIRAILAPDEAVAF